MYKRLTKIDGSMLGDHYYLEPDDYCTFMGEYTARKGYEYSSTNQLISNFKKPVNLRGTDQWPYKERAIHTVAQSMVACLSPWARDITIVPVPPSKCRADVEYDDRMSRVLELCQQSNPDMDCRELITQNISMDAAHLSVHRPKPHELVEAYSFDGSLAGGVRNTIIIVDDVMTTGCHYKAMQTVLKQRFPNNQIAGVFVARRAPLSGF